LKPILLQLFILTISINTLGLEKQLRNPNEAEMSEITSVVYSEIDVCTNINNPHQYTYNISIQDIAESEREIDLYNRFLCGTLLVIGEGSKVSLSPKQFIQILMNSSDSNFANQIRLELLVNSD